MVNTINELKINVNVTPDVTVNTKVTPNAEIVAKVTSGARGKSAYEIWLDGGHTGTEEDFLNWLRSDSFIYTQMTSSSEWIITHNLGKYPAVTIVDTADSVVVGEIEYLSMNEIRVSFNATFSGKAYLN